MKFIPDDINVDFMGARKKALIGSAIAVTASVVALLAFGLNQGIDFKGGNQATVAFVDGSINDRQPIVDAVTALLVEELGTLDSQVTVQDFTAGSSNETTVCTEVPGVGTAPASQDCRTVSVDRFLIYTEVSSLIDGKRGQEVIAAIKAKYGDGTLVRMEEGSDAFNITFAAPTNIAARDTDLRELFKTLEYENVTIKSTRERDLDGEFLEERELMRQDQLRGQTEAGQATGGFAIKTMEEHEADKDKILAEQTDTEFQVGVQQFRSELTEKLEAAFPGKFIAVESTTAVSSAVGKELFSNGLLAILYALIGILIYITVRFDFRYAPGAVVALLHDVIITMGLFALLQVKFSLPIIAALLTIVGYSLNDTIVVLDRVRETFDTYRGRPMEELLTRAINSTLSRTVLTSLTTLMVVVSILLFGGGTITDFALALTIGIVIGTYSSIFIASPLVYYMDQYITRRESETATASGRAGNNSPGGKDGQGRKKASA
jgi:preprotein translocase subunit SecF